MVEILIKKGVDERGMNFLLPRLRERLQEEVNQKKRQLEDPFTSRGLTEPGRILSDIRKLERQLEKSDASQLTAVDKDNLFQEMKQLEEEIKEGMPTYEEQMEKAPGAVRAHMQWEKQNKKKIARWKNIRRALHHDEVDNPDVSNVEMLRRRGKVTARTAPVGKLRTEKRPIPRGRPPKARLGRPVEEIKRDLRASKDTHTDSGIGDGS